MHRSSSPWWLAVLLAAAGSVHAEEGLIQARTLVVDPHLDQAQAEGEILAARRYGTFWATGDAALARAALAADFTDRTLPPGRAQGLSGPLAASVGFRQAVPDLRCEIEQMIVAGDRVVSHLRFTGHFSGQFQGHPGQGQAVNFIATDIYRVQDGRIAENWHLEDNLTLLQQMGLVAL